MKILANTSKSTGDTLKWAAWKSYRCFFLAKCSFCLMEACWRSTVVKQQHENMKRPSCCCRNLHLTLIISPAGCATKHIWGGEASVFSVLTPGCAFFSFYARHPSLPNGSVNKHLWRKTLRALRTTDNRWKRLPCVLGAGKINLLLFIPPASVHRAVISLSPLSDECDNNPPPVMENGSLNL